MEIRFAKEEELAEINGLREQVNALHAENLPGIFKPGFPEELRDYVFEIFRDPMKRIVVCESEGKICAFAVLSHIKRPETPFMFERDFLDIDEFCVDADFRRRGIATRMIEFIRDLAKSEGFRRVELNMWEFNRDALAFYEAAGFTTYRRYIVLKF
jgi:ribosomal protein S18 acetylase RimI-like enzyme